MKQAQKVKRDHDAMEALRREHPGAMWIYDGQQLWVVGPRDYPELEKYADPVDAITYWLENQ